MVPRISCAPVIVVFVALVSTALSIASTETVTLSGTVTGPGGAPADSVRVAAWVPGGEPSEVDTDSAGRYSLTLEAGPTIVHLRAPEAARLGERMLWLGELSGSVSRDFQLRAGALVAGIVTRPDGRPVDSVRVRVEPASFSFTEGEWLLVGTDLGTGHFRVMVPVGQHWISADPDPPYFSVHQPLDLTKGDVTDLVLTLSATLLNPLPQEPPDASRITIGSVDGLGQATITGSTGAALPSAKLLLVNLDSSHQTVVASAGDGSFSATLFAPPGSAIQIKHGPPGENWYNAEAGASEGFSPLPATILHAPIGEPTRAEGLWFADAGGIQVQADDKVDTTNSVGAGWSIEGTLASAGSTRAPGDPLEIDGTFRLYSHGIGSADDLAGIRVNGYVGLRQVFDGNGHGQPAVNNYMSTVLTVTGLPIQSAEPAEARVEFEPIPLEEFEFVGGHSAEASFDWSGRLPEDLPSGTYRPVIYFDFQNVPTTTDWVSAWVFGFTYDHAMAALPPILVGPAGRASTGDLEDHRLPMRLLAENYVLGTRGAGAVEDAEWFQLASQIATQGAPFIVPPLDSSTARRISYRLEPFLPTITFTDRRMPGPPLIPLRFPSGALHVLIEEPGGGVRELGPAPFVQSMSRTNSTAAGWGLNPGTQQLDDMYSLTTGDDSFRVTFDEYGLHHVIMEAEVEDLWGNGYRGGGVYELWVAQPLDLDPGVLPGVPFAIGDAFDPAIRITPRVPAEVTLTVTQVPYSDPAQAFQRTVSGHANRHGYFSTLDEPITFAAPGEYRVDLTARYLAPTGELYMGAMVWGGIVMTPEGEAQLVAHGRRGVDSQQTMPASWFVSSQDLDIPAGAISHTFNPYFAGDILWSRISDGPWGGDSLLIMASVQDTVGEIADAIADRLQGHPLLSEDRLIQDRLGSGELPLFTATPDGRSSRLYPERIEQIGYSYRSSQRPGVRVREVISDDLVTGGYWRLDTLYDDQPGVGVLGDQPNDFKFQYVGAVYRDLEAGRNEYVGQGTGWIFIPDQDQIGTRVMPPYAGPGNGGWTTTGGPILTLMGRDVDMFILPTGARPGAVLEVGDVLHFAGHLMPTLPSEVAAEIRSPGGAVHEITGHASPVGYFYRPDADLVIEEPGRWTVDVAVWHEGQCSGGSTVPPYPSGDVLGSRDGRYEVYVPTPGEPPLRIVAPVPGDLYIGDEVDPIDVVGVVPSDLSHPVVHYTISMPGYILANGQTTPRGGRFEVTYDPVDLQRDFPNLDLVGRDEPGIGLADTVSIALLAEGARDGVTVYLANTVTLQGEQVSVGTELARLSQTPRRGGRRLP